MYQQLVHPQGELMNIKPNRNLQKYGHVEFLFLDIDLDLAPTIIFQRYHRTSFHMETWKVSWLDKLNLTTVAHASRLNFLPRSRFYVVIFDTLMVPEWRKITNDDNDT